jgi:hypothetical protein
VQLSRVPFFITALAEGQAYEENECSEKAAEIN